MDALKRLVRGVLPANGRSADSMMSADEVRWVYRLFLNREPESEDIVEAQRRAYPDVAALRKVMVNTPEFRGLVREPANQGIMQFLLPEAKDGKIVIELPTLENPASQMCTYRQMHEQHFIDFCKKIHFDHTHMHRKHWEWAFIHRVLQVAGMLKQGTRGLAFAIGEEPLPSVLATLGVNVMATDGPPEVAEFWGAGAQYANDLKTLWHDKIVDWETFQKYVSHGVADMNNIPDTLRDYDFCWSSCSFEHLGGIQKGIDFFINSLDTLRPGGIAVHTTEFNLSSNDDTVDASPTCIFRRQDFETIARRLTEAGHEVWPLNFFPGDKPLDAHVDFPPYSNPHLRVALLNYVTTSAGIVARKKG